MSNTTTICYVKRRTDPLGGIKVYLGGNSHNPHGYVELRHINRKQISPTTSGITISLWNEFWNEMAQAEQRGDTNLVAFILLVFVMFVATMLFVVLTTPQLNQSYQIIVMISLVFILGIVGCCFMKGTIQQWKYVMESYKSKFQQVGYNVELLFPTSCNFDLYDSNKSDVTSNCYLKPQDCQTTKVSLPNRLYVIYIQ